MASFHLVIVSEYNFVASINNSFLEGNTDLMKDILHLEQCCSHVCVTSCQQDVKV